MWLVGLIIDIRAISKDRKAARDARPTDVYPSCNMALPATGDCDNCS